MIERSQRRPDIRTLIPIDGVTRSIVHVDSIPTVPSIRGTAQNPDVFFQAREACNPYYDAVPDIVQASDGPIRRARPGAFTTASSTTSVPPMPEEVIVMMGSGCATVESSSPSHAMVASVGRRSGSSRFASSARSRPTALIAASFPSTVADHRCPRPHQGARRRRRAAPAQDVDGSRSSRRPRQGRTILADRMPRSSVAASACPRRSSPRRWLPAVFAEARKGRSEAPVHGRHRRRCHRTCRIDVRHGIRRRAQEGEGPCAVFYGLGADGTVGANKNTVKIIGDETDHVRPGVLRLRLQEVRRHDGHPTCGSTRQPDRCASYLIDDANFVACHQFEFLSKVDVLAKADTMERRSSSTARSVPMRCGAEAPTEVQQTIIDKELRCSTSSMPPPSLATRASASASTPCSRPASSPWRTCDAAGRGDRGHQGGDRQVVREVRRCGRCSQQCRSRRCRCSASPSGEVPDRGDFGRSACARPVPDDAPDFVSAGDGDDARGPGRPAAGLGDCRSTGPSRQGTTKFEKRSIADRHPDLRPGHLHRVREVRARVSACGDPMKVFEESALEGAPEGVQVPHLP